jgi:plasmid stability protein
MMAVQRMGNLSVRKLDDDTIERLRIRAAEHGVSMEEEARRILSQAVAAPARLGDLAVELLGPNHGGDLELPHATTHKPLDLED